MIGVVATQVTKNAKLEMEKKVKAGRTEAKPTHEEKGRHKSDTESSPTQTNVQPDGPNAYPGAPFCESHNNSEYHGLWNEKLKCHYDHEHGENPFTTSVVSAFPGFNLRELIGNVEIGHTNPSGPMENTHKHGGFKWDVTLSHNAGCKGRESVPTGVDALVVQYHNFGDYSVEFESRVHSAVGLLRQCKTSNPTDFGYIFVNQHQDYGQRVSPYQGNILTYPDTPVPAYTAAREPYFAVSCFGGSAPCSKYPSRQAILSRNSDTHSTWISEPGNLNGSGSTLFGILFRLRDTYQSLDASDLSHPFSFSWMCSSDGGKSYAAQTGCRYNNSTSRVHEVMGRIPEAWDNLAGFDTDSRTGRITATGFVKRFGELAPDCQSAGPDCHPIKLVNAFSGRYGTGFQLTAEKSPVFDALNLPERDIYFCNGVACKESDAEAKSSGWIGNSN